MNLWRQIQRWFKRRSQGVNDPFMAEPLPQRPKHPLVSIEDLAVLWQWIRTEAASPQKEYQEGAPLFVLQGTTVSGFLLTAGETINAPFLVSLFEWLRRHLPSIGYQQAHADRRHYHEGEWLRTIERLAFRPNVMAQVRAGTFPLDQRYGPITVELTYLNNIPHQLRLTVKPLHDRRYRPARPFESFVAALANVHPAS